MGAGRIEGLCSACLLTLGLRGIGEEPEDGAEPEPAPKVPSGSGEGPSGAGRADARGRLRPLGAGLVAPLSAMPAELLHQAARRLRVAAFGFSLGFAVSILLNNLVASASWYSYSHLPLKNVVAAAMIAISVAVGFVVHTRPLAPGQLVMLTLTYEVVIALGISIGDHLEPLLADVPLSNVSWLCVCIVMFPLVVPAPPRRALLASVAAASTWPLAYLLRLAMGGSASPVIVVALNCLENYVAVGLALFATWVMRRLQELGCYQLEERLDHGGMGEIWRARHHLLARPVAVKLIRPELFGVKNAVEAAALVGRFRREAEATAALHSPHTIALHDFGMTPEGTFYYVMELLEGLDLETLVRRFGPVPPERAIHLLMQACESLADAHAVGLIHRDVKPANIVTCRWGLKDDFVKVLDFGLVKGTSTLREDDGLTTEGMIAGTPSYIAPEVALGGRVLSASVDIYGLGCVAYWLLTGERLFTGSTPMEVVLHHAKTEPVAPSVRAGRSFPEALEQLVLSCLAKAPEDRPPSAEWLRDRLAECRTEDSWTPSRAREWWERHVLASDRAASAAGPNSRATTGTTLEGPPSSGRPKVGR